jgi:hypothetical protein
MTVITDMYRLKSKPCWLSLTKAHLLMSGPVTSQKRERDYERLLILMTFKIHFLAHSKKTLVHLYNLSDHWFWLCNFPAPSKETKVITLLYSPAKIPIYPQNVPLISLCPI